MIGFSCPPLCYYPVNEVIEEIAKNFSLWEIVAEHFHHPSLAGKELNALLPSYSLKMQVHAPLSDINIASISRSVREASIRELKEAISFARQIDADVVTLHPGHKSPMTIEHEEIVFSLTKEALFELEKYAEEMGVKLGLENMPDMSVAICKTPQQISQLLNNTAIGVCFDIGHANTNQNIDDFFELRDLFVNVHIHDNDGKKDAHATVGEGNIDFKRLCPKFSSYAGNFIIEARTIESGIRSKQRLSALGYS